MKSYEQFLDEDGLYTDAADRAYLESLPETQREKILYDRYCALKAVEEKRQLRSLTESSRLGTSQSLTESTADTLSTSAPAPASCHFTDCDFVVSRNLLISAIFRPTLTAFKGCFVRVHINNKYRLCKITGFTRVVPYPLYNSKKELSDIALVLDSGAKLYKDIQVTNVSTQPVMEDEFNQFLQDFSITTLSGLSARFRKAQKEATRELNVTEAAEMVQTRERANPRKKSRAEQKIDLILKRDEALQGRNKAAAAQYQRQIEEMENEERRAKRQREAEEIEEARRRLENQR